MSVPADYPRGYPLFALRLLESGEKSAAQTHLNNDGIRDIERELNLYPDDLVHKAGKKNKTTTTHKITRIHTHTPQNESVNQSINSPSF